MNLLAPIEGILNDAEGLVLIWMGVFIRVGAAAFMLPGMGERFVSVRVRLGGALALSAAIMPMAAAAAGPPPPFEPLIFAPVFLAEAACGLLLGLATRFLIFTLQIAGTMAAQSLSVAQMFGGMGGEPQPAISSLLVMAGIALAMTAGFHVKVVEMLIGSYVFFPFGVFPAGSDAAAWSVARAQGVFELAVGLALPFLVVGFVYNLALGAINRAMPQLMVAFVGAPAITGAGIALMMLAAPVVLMFWLERLDAVLANPLDAIP